MFRKAFLASVVVLSLAAVASAAPTIIGGLHEFPQNSGLQEFYIMASGEAGPDNIAGVDLHMEITGAGAPLVTVFDLISDATLLFNPQNSGQGNYGFPDAEVPTLAPAGFTTTPIQTPPIFINPNGRLARIVIDTTGVPQGDYPLLLSHPVFGPSDLPPFGPGTALLEDGLIRITPEPSSVVMGLFAVAGFGAFVIRRRRARKA